MCICHIIGEEGFSREGNAAAIAAGKTAVRDEVVIVGLEKVHVDQFEVLVFLRSKVMS